MRLSLCCFPVFSACALAAVPAIGAEAVSAQVIEPLSRELVTPESIFQMLIALGVVVAAIFLVAWLLRRIGTVSVKSGQLKIVAGLALGQRERVLLVQVGNSHQVLLGVTQGKISKLCAFDSPIVEAGDDGGDFSQRLRGALKIQGNKSP